MCALDASKSHATRRLVRSSVWLVALVSAAVLASAHYEKAQLKTASPSSAPAAEPPTHVLSAAPPAEQVCPDDSVLVSGAYCPKVALRCLQWLDDPKLPFARCALYERPARCLAERVPMRFCIDRYEYTPVGASLPLNFASFAKAVSICENLGKRVCTEDEWNFACEGEEIRPYPYGFSRQPICNQDHSDIYEWNPRRRILRDLREPATARPECVSLFGVYNMVGNLDEPVQRSSAQYGFYNALKGGWWIPARNRCRPATIAHDDFYQGIQVGVRCCRDALTSATEGGD